MNTADSQTIPKMVEPTPIFVGKNFGIGTIFMEDDAPFCLLSNKQLNR
jgi:hypothetical protein